MKKIVIIIPIFFFSVFLTAQSDIIYPSKGDKDIVRCKITKVNNLNIVYYQKGSEIDSIEAIAILRDKSLINLTSNNQQRLYKNHNYGYYLTQYNDALVNRKIGIWIAGSGIVMLVSGILTVNYTLSHQDGCELCPMGILIVICGIINTSIGGGISISANVKVKNNKRAMEITHRSANLSFGATNNGVGLVLNF